MPNFYLIHYQKSSNQSSKFETVPNDSFLLSTDYWDDYSFVTMFHMYYKNKQAEKIPIGEIKISFIGQNRNDYENKKLDSTYLKLEDTFDKLNDNFFSLGQSPEFYENFYKLFGRDSIKYLSLLNDLSANPDLIYKYSNEDAFNASLLRTIDEWQIKNQFHRIIKGGAKLDDYDFKFKYFDKYLNFNIKASSSPPTNLHALIGRNGVGKTSVLNSMFDNLLVQELDNSDDVSKSIIENTMFIDNNTSSRISSDYFSKAIYISYSIFGEYFPKITNSDSFSYMGLKDIDTEGNYFIRDLDKLSGESIDNLAKIKSSSSMRDLFKEIIIYFSESYDKEVLDSLLSSKEEHAFTAPKLKALSSGHTIVLIVIINLIANAVEKTLVLFDEPETHLHPPLLSALIRAINDILVNRNGVCIFATHSPVVLQEIPKSCIYALFREGESFRFERPRIETFGENVSTLTHEIFALEIKSTGFYNILTSEFNQDNNLEAIKDKFNNEIGSEALSLLYLLEYNSEIDINDSKESLNK